VCLGLLRLLLPQEHFFAVPEPGKMAARINWRINKPNGEFIERSVVQVGITLATVQYSTVQYSTVQYSTARGSYG
jgi:hypothetical protein